MSALRHGWTLLAALAASGCGQPIAPPVENEAERLMSGCAETGRLLDQMKAAEPGFRYDEDGNATVTRQMWEMLPAGMRTGLMQAVAYRAVCASGEQREQEVTIRASDDSEILAQETVTDFAR